jgi:hypothetical protein
MRALRGYLRVELVTRKVVKKVNRKFDYPLSYDATGFAICEGHLLYPPADSVSSL